jgi:glutamate synthase domain-containing protein 2
LKIESRVKKSRQKTNLFNKNLHQLQEKAIAKYKINTSISLYSCKCAHICFFIVNSNEKHFFSKDKYNEMKGKKKEREERERDKKFWNGFQINRCLQFYSYW